MDIFKLNPYITKDNQEFYLNIYNLAKEKVLPSILERDKDSIWDSSLWDLLSKNHLTGLSIPEEYGGQSASCLQCCLANESFNSGCLDDGLSLSWAAHMIIGTLPIVLFGNTFQKKKYLPKLASGEWIAAFGLTESSSGSDAASMKTFAEEVDDKFIINGSKTFITNGSIADVLVIFAKTQTKDTKIKKGKTGISAFIIEKNFKGFFVSKDLNKTGHNTSKTSELFFDDMEVPKENLLGEINSGFFQIGQATLEWERTVLTSGFLGGINFITRSSFQYAKQRKQFNTSIYNFFPIQERLAKMWVYLQSCYRLIYTVANMKDLGENISLESALVKLYISETANELSNDAIQVHGGYGYIKEYHVERFYRSSKLGTIGAGTSEILRKIITTFFKQYEPKLDNLMKHTKTSPQLSSFNDLETTLKKLNFNTEETICFSIWKELKLLLDKSYQNRDGFKKSFYFIFADLITLHFILTQAFLDLLIDHKMYHIDQKRKDLVLLTWFLISRYSRSLHAISGLNNCEINIQEIFKLYTKLKFKQVQSNIESMMEYAYH